MHSTGLSSAVTMGNRQWGVVMRLPQHCNPRQGYSTTCKEVACLSDSGCGCCLMVSHTLLLALLLLLPRCCGNSCCCVQCFLTYDANPLGV